MSPIEVLRRINDTVDRCPLCGESRLMEATMEWGWMPGEIAHTTTCPMGDVGDAVTYLPIRDAAQRSTPAHSVGGIDHAPKKRQPIG